MAGELELGQGPSGLHGQLTPRDVDDQAETLDVDLGRVVESDDTGLEVQLATDLEAVAVRRRRGRRRSR